MTRETKIKRKQNTNKIQKAKRKGKVEEIKMITSKKIRRQRTNKHNIRRRETRKEIKVERREEWERGSKEQCIHPLGGGGSCIEPFVLQVAGTNQLLGSKGHCFNWEENQFPGHLSL
jgi:hypothetical protein